MHGEDDQDGIDLYTLSELQQKYRIKIWEKVEEVRSIPGYEKVFLLDTASQIGVRMSRILEGEYRLTLKDSMTYKTFDDVIGISGAWTTIIYKGRKVSKTQRPLWQIPYRSILPKKTKNLLTAGRCFCFEKALVEDARIIGTCLVETGSKMDDLIYEEFKGTGNQELHLVRKLAERRIYPAIDLQRSGTRQEQLLYAKNDYPKVLTMRRMVDLLGENQRTELFLEQLKKSKSNVEFLKNLKTGQ